MQAIYVYIAIYRIIIYYIHKQNKLVDNVIMLDDELYNIYV